MASLGRTLSRNRERLLAFSLARSLSAGGWACDRGAEEIDAWFGAYARLGRDLGAGIIDATAWRDGMSRLFAELRLSDLLARIDFDAIGRHMRLLGRVGRGELFHTILIDGRKPEGDPAAEPDRVAISKVVYVRKGHSVPPHGHGNMVSAFLHLSGEFQVRQFDKLADDGESLVIRPRTDILARRGQWTSVTEHRNNVHWLTAVSDDCFLFTTKLIRIDDAKPFHGRINLDVRSGVDVGGGRVRAPKISAERAQALYGRRP